MHLSTPRAPFLLWGRFSHFSVKGRLGAALHSHSTLSCLPAACRGPVDCPEALWSEPMHLRVHMVEGHLQLRLGLRIPTMLHSPLRQLIAPPFPAPAPCGGPRVTGHLGKRPKQAQTGLDL